MPSLPRSVPLLALAATAAVALWAASIYGTGPLSGSGECRAARAVSARIAPLAKGEVAALSVLSTPKPAPAIAFNAPDGRPIYLAALNGKVRLVNFWATWCVPCRKEFPDLVRIGADYRERGLQFALISADDVSEIKTTVPRFLREMRAASISAYLLNATDTEAAIAQVDQMWGGELPATFLFDRQGKVAYRHFGIIKDAELREAIEKVVTGDR